METLRQRFSKLSKPVQTIIYILTTLSAILTLIIIPPQLQSMFATSFPECIGAITIRGNDAGGYQCVIPMNGDYEIGYVDGAYAVRDNPSLGDWRTAFLIFDGQEITLNEQGHPNRNDALISMLYISQEHFETRDSAETAAQSMSTGVLSSLVKGQVLTFVVSDIENQYHDNTEFIEIRISRIN